MFYGNLKKTDIANGEGVRVTLYVSGCTNHCPGCFQPETWQENYGKEYTEDTVHEILQALKPEYIQGLTLLGGEPFELYNQPELARLTSLVKQFYPSKDIWCYTGFVLDQDLLEGGRRHGPHTDELLSNIDVLVDGPFKQDLKDITLQFRGSSNQRIIDLPASLKAGDIVLKDLHFL